MSLTAGVITLVQAGQTQNKLSATAASGGTGPYTQQWYRSTTTGFSPGGGNIIAGATALTLTDTGLVPNTQYYYKVVYTDTGASNATITATQLGVITMLPQPSQNRMQQAAVVGMIDMRFNPNTVAVQIDISQATPLYAGSPVKIVNSADGIPKVVGCAASSDECLGFINYNIKNVAFIAGMPAEISMASNVMFLYATSVIARGSRVALDLAGNGVTALLGSGGADIVGWAYDQAPSPGTLIRVFLLTPSFAKDGV